MRILRLTPHFYWPQLSTKGWPVPFDAIGGMQTQIFRQSQKLAELGVEQIVLTLKIPGAPVRWQVNERLMVQGVRIPILPLRSRIRGLMDLNISWALGVMNEVLRRYPRCDVVHVHCSGVFWPLLVGFIVAPILKSRLVLTVHCSVLATYEAMHSFDHAVQPLSRRIERNALRSSAHVIALSNRSREAFLRQVDLSPESISVIPDSIDVEHFRSQASVAAVDAFRQRFNLNSDRPVVAYVGRVAREKGWRRFIELADVLRHRHYHFLVCGDGNERDLMEQQITRRSLDKHFTITGYLPQQDIPAALATASVLVLTSLHEEFGGVLIEGMAMEVPQVAFAIGGIPNVVVDGETGYLVPPEDIEGMAHAIDRLLTDKTLAARMGAAGLARVRHNFDLDQACRKIYGVYKRLTV